MKKTLSFILAVLMLSASMTACNTEPTKETEKNNETEAVETIARETDMAETDMGGTEAPESAYALDTVTENGIAKAHIVVSEGADDLLGYGAEELVYHIRLVSGAEVPVTNTANADSLPIIIATPDSNPELEELFPEDLSWLRDLGEEGTDIRFGDDGFAIRLYDNKLYIFGVTPRGALNGVYDFIEENMGVLWTQGNENLGLIYDEMPTITLQKDVYAVGHKEKSPFDLRAWHLTGGMNESDGILKMLSRNKMNGGIVAGFTEADNGWATSMGIEDVEIGHTVKWLIYISPLYDENVNEYWCTTPSGEHGDISSSTQINFWSDVTVEAMAASLTNFYDTYGKAPFVGVEDFDTIGTVYPEMTEPYEYAPGQFVNPGEGDYNTTVYFSFMNKVARKVAETHPDLDIPTFAYFFTEDPPRCDIEDNIIIYYAPINEEVNKPIDHTGDSPAADIYQRIESWKQKTRKIVFYNYYGCYKTNEYYERPIWYKIQGDLRYYAENGFMGLLPEGNASAANWEMNALTYWIYAKLSWNPYEDVDELIRYFCDKCYGDASEEMQEYYRLIKAGWDEGTVLLEDAFNAYLKWNTIPMFYFDNFIDNSDFVENEGLLEKIRAALDSAWEAAGDAEKERIRHIRECYAQDDLFF